MRNDYVQDDFDDFDDFEPRPQRRRIFTKLVTMILLGGFVGFLAYVYTDGDKIGTANMPSIIHKAENPFKVKPASPGGMAVPHRDKTVFERLLAGRRNKTPESSTRLSRLPEEPVLPRDDAEASRAGRSHTAVPEIEAPLIPNDTDATHRAASDGSAEFASTDKIAPVRRARDITTTDLSGEIRLQLASLRTGGAVKRAWSRMQQNFPDLLGDLALSVVRMDLGTNRGVFYRMQVGPIESADSARALCGKLRAHRTECLVVKP